MARFLSEALRQRGAEEVYVVEVPREGAQGAYVFARWGRPRLLLNAHLDTVPANAGWTGDPFEPRRTVVDGAERVVGRGSADTKGAIAAILCALVETPVRDLGVLFSGDEEHTGTCIRAFLDGPLSVGVEHALVFEPTGCRVGTRHRGILAMQVRVAGSGGHSSRADRLPAPLADLAEVAVALSRFGRARALEGPRGFEGLCMNIARFDGGIAFNVIPDSATLEVSVRPPPGADVPRLRHELAAIVQGACPHASVTFPVDNPPFQTRDLAAFGALPAVREGAMDLAFWTEAAAFSERGIDAVVFGPGHIDQAHAPDEWVAVEQLVRARDAVKALLSA